LSNQDRIVKQSHRPAILLAEDSAVIQTVVRNMLILWGHEVVTAADGLQAWRILESDRAPRLAVFDWIMPGLQGPELCRRLRQRSPEPYTYVLLLTSRDDCQDVVEGLDAGADDYLTKPFHAQELRARIRAGERILRLQEELVAAREELRERATIDHLTQLLNRASVLDALDRNLGRAEREGMPLSVLLVDVDRFRQINESFGHWTGDSVLCEFGRRIVGAVPPGAVVGRYSGEEFLVLLPGIGSSEARRFAAEIRDAIGLEPFRVGAGSFPVTCAVGIAERPLSGTSDPAALLRAADDSLLEAKRESQLRIAGALRASAASVARPVTPLP
jgi:diguanylate cyclase (GGDEF)-like protein